MSNNRKEYPKLRFALITEEALKMLQPQTAHEMNSPSTSPANIHNMYEVINTTVNTILERKIRNLRLDKLEQLDKLDEIIENKVSEILERRLGAKKNVHGVHETLSSDTVSDFGQNLLRSGQIFNLIDARIEEAKLAQKPWDSPRHTHHRQQPQPQPQPQPVPTRKSKIRQVSGADRKKNTKGSQTHNYVQPPQSQPIKKASDIITKYFDNQYEADYVFIKIGRHSEVPVTNSQKVRNVTAKRKIY